MGADVLSGFSGTKDMPFNAINEITSNTQHTSQSALIDWLELVSLAGSIVLAAGTVVLCACTIKALRIEALLHQSTTQPTSVIQPTSTTHVAI